MVQIYGTTQGRDLGAVAADIRRVVAANATETPKGVQAVLLGQVVTMNSAFTGLLFGLLGAIVLIYLLIVVNFQSWSDPFVIVTALPAALAGIVWTLFATHTTLSVPALTGAIMCMGVATANSVLVISFAREQLDQRGDAVAAALEAGFVRFRPVLMTALAMIIGMAPMALGLGEGGEQNAPLGRAVVGGLVFATVATLIFVPVVFSIFHDTAGEAKPPAMPRGMGNRMQPDPAPPGLSRRRLAFAGLVAAAVAAIIVVMGITSRRAADAKLGDWTETQAVPVVAARCRTRTARARRSIFPAGSKPISQAQIYARVSGYLKAGRPTSARRSKPDNCSPTSMRRP